MVVGIAVPMAHGVEQAAPLLVRPVFIAMEIPIPAIPDAVVRKMQEEQRARTGVALPQVHPVKEVLVRTVALVAAEAILAVVVPATAVAVADPIMPIPTYAPTLPIRKEQGKVTAWLPSIIRFHSVFPIGYLYP